jgi:hypothetical protein
MDRLLDSFKIDDYRAYSIMYFLIFLLTLFIISIIIAVVLLFRNGTVSITKLFDSTITLPTVSTSYILYGLGVFVFIVIVAILYRSQTSCNLSLKDKPDSLVPSVFWKPDTAVNTFDPRNLRITSDEWQPKTCTGLSLGAEIVIFNSRTAISSSPYRHILHRGSSDLYNYSGNAPGSAPAGAGGLNDGLPSEMSPGIFIDRHTNDIIVYVDTETEKISNSANKFAFRESIRINDLPLNVPFYLHLVISSKVLEIYVNCRLAGTKVLHGKPRNVQNEWFGRTGFATSQAIVQNLTLWDGALNTFELMKLCKNKIVIKKEIWDIASNINLPALNLGQCGTK